ncbi:MAG: hypothetical protein QOD65_2339, partial [Gaiellales bacterium]|nr:hypothetical protein [Gaiellales bacterium]
MPPAPHALHKRRLPRHNEQERGLTCKVR